MKKIITIIIYLMLVTGCRYKQIDNDNLNNNEYNDELITCISNELDNYISQNNEKLQNLNVNDISSNKDKIYYFQGKYTKDNMYIILVENNKSFSADIINDFENFFLKKYSNYQRYEISYEGVTIFAHVLNKDINFEKIVNKCNTNKKSNKNGKTIPNSMINKLKFTNKMIIKRGNIKIGTITNAEAINEMLGIIKDSRQDGDIFLLDNYAFDFEMYNDNKLIDHIYVWYDGKRLSPNPKEGYYSILEKDIRKLIEENTDYIFYNIMDMSESGISTLELVYKDNKYEYYLSCHKSEEVLIHFALSSKIMSLKDALNNNYITAEKVANDYPDILIKKDRQN